MKKFLPLLLVCSISACFPVPTESDITACPSEGLQSVAFYSGKPPGGTLIPAEAGDKGQTVWDFDGYDNFIYMKCTYASGLERVQQLYDKTKSCRQQTGGALSCKSWL